MQDEKSALLEQAHRCRRLAHTIITSDVADKLTAMAQDFEDRAARIALVDVGMPGLSPLGTGGMS
jgi:hypothetical protein